jgi:3-hydroxyacyl-CoA dehydrogenase/enoyl-CoA hydratase/3-hydroxybutyryl-CoA epimerase
VRAKKALLGLIDELVHPSILRSVAIQRAREVAEGRRKSEHHAGGVKGMLLDGNPAGRAIVLRKAREQTLAKSRGNYPALIAAIDEVAAGYERGVAHGYREESRKFGEMAMTDVSRQLIFLFFATNELKKDPGVEPSQYPELPVAAFEPLPVAKIAIIGARLHGGGHCIDRGAAEVSCDSRTPIMRVWRRDTPRCATCSRSDSPKADHQNPVQRHMALPGWNGRLLRIRETSIW